MKNENAYELRQAAKNGDVNKIKSLLDAGENVDALRNAPLRRAVRHGQVAAASLIMDCGAPLAGDETELVMSAAKNGDAPMLGLLLSRMQKPFDTALLDNALVEVVKSGNIVAVNTLLDAGADPNDDDSLALMTAATGGNTAILRLLVSYGVNVNARDAQCLFNTVFSRHPKALDYLLGVGIDLQAQLGVPLKLAIMNGDGEAVEALLRAGMPMTDPGWVAEVAQSDSIETLLLLQELGADWTNYADEMVAMAARNGRPRMLQYLFDNALILDRQNITDALDEAAKDGNATILLLLLEHRADPAGNQSAALRAAVEAGQLGVAQILLEAGAHATDLPHTAFVRVVEGGKIPLALNLLRAGIALNLNPVSHFTAWRITEEFGRDAMFKDKLGNRHPRTICESRLQFCGVVVQQARNHGEADPARLTLWLSEMLAGAGH